MNDNKNTNTTRQPNNDRTMRAPQQRQPKQTVEPVTKSTAKPATKKTSSSKKTSSKQKQQTEEVVRKTLKRSSSFLFRLFVNIVLVYAVVRLFSYSFNFAYSVFGDVAKDPGSTEYVIVEIPKDSSVLKIGEALEEAEIIDDKFVFYVRVKIKNYSNKITPGKYGLSPSMTFDEIAEVICDLDIGEEE